MIRSILLLVLLSGIHTARAETLDFRLPDLEGQEVALSDFRGQWVLVNYWATWCAPCRKEMPELSELDAKRDDFVVLGLLYDEAEMDVVHKILKARPVVYPILRIDPFEPPEGLEIPRVLPTSLLVSPTGLVVERAVGAITADQIEGWIAQHASSAQ